MSTLDKVRVDGVDYDLVGAGEMLPIGTELDIDSNAEIPAGWEEVDDKYEIYSTTERCIGRWVDGKPLYKITFIGNLPNTTASTTLVHLDATYDTIILDNEVSVLIRETQEVLPANYFYNTTDYSRCCILLDDSADKRGIRIRTGADLSSSNFKYIFTIKYTKTADTANTHITKRIKKVTQTTPASLEEINDDQERVVGTWFGKPLYRKVGSIIFTENTSGSHIQGSFISSVIENVTISNVFTSNLGATGLYNGYDSTFKSCLYVENGANDSNKGYLMGYNNRSSYLNKTIYAVVEYTKTTDIVE